MKTHYWLTLFALLPLTIFAEPAAPPIKINVMARIPSPTEPYPRIVGCRFEDTFKYRKAENPTDPDIPTIEIGEHNINDPKIKDYCISTIGNLTRFNEQAVRDEIAEILKDLPCKPDANVTLYFSSILRPMDKVPEGVKHGRVVNSFTIRRCLETMPADCSYPTADATFDTHRDLVDYDAMMKTIRRCKEQIVQKVKDEGLEKKWEAEKAAKELHDKKEETGARVVPTEEKKR